MPEACDVVIVVEYLVKHFIGKKILNVRASEGREYVTLLVGATLSSVTSHGKVIHLKWTEDDGNELFMTIHLMLHGRLYDESHCQDQGHYFTFTFDSVSHKSLTMYDHMNVATCDLHDEEPSREGKCVMSGGIGESDVLPHLTKGNLFTTLTKQSSIVGIGSQLATEILHHAHIHPGRHGIDLSSSERTSLVQAINRIPSLVRNCGGFYHSRPVSPDGGQGHYIPCYNTIEMRKVKVSGKLTYTLEQD